MWPRRMSDGFVGWAIFEKSDRQTPFTMFYSRPALYVALVTIALAALVECYLAMEPISHLSPRTWSLYYLYIYIYRERVHTYEYIYAQKHISIHVIQFNLSNRSPPQIDHAPIWIILVRSHTIY